MFFIIITHIVKSAECKPNSIINLQIIINNTKLDPRDLQIKDLEPILQITVGSLIHPNTRLEGQPVNNSQRGMSQSKWQPQKTSESKR